MQDRRWHILYYESKDGVCPVQDFLNRLPDRDRAKVLCWFEQFEQQGPQLPRPYADLLEDGIHELRVKLAGNQIRVLYFFCYRDFVIMTHDFEKHTDRVPSREIARSKRCRADFLARHTENHLRRLVNENLSKALG